MSIDEIQNSEGDQVNIDLETLVYERRAVIGGRIMAAIAVVFIAAFIIFLEADTIIDYSILSVLGLLVFLGVSISGIVKRWGYYAAASLIFITNLVLIFITVGLVRNLGFLPVFYLGSSSGMLLLRMFPSNRRLWGGVATGLVLISMLVFEALDLPFRTTPRSAATTVILIGTVLMTLAFLVSLALEASVGSIQTKLLVAFITGTIVVTGVVTIVTLTLVSRALTDSLGAQLKSIAEVSAINVGNLVDQQVSTLRALSLSTNIRFAINSANITYGTDQERIQTQLESLDQRWRAADAADNDNDPLVQDRFNNIAATDLREYQRSFPDNAEVFVTDRYGGLVATTSRTSDYYQADEEWWQQAYNNGFGWTYISNPVYDDSVGALSIQIALPIKASDGREIIGVIRSTYLLSGFNSILDVQVGDTGALDIIFPGNIYQHLHEGELREVEPDLYNALQATQNDVYIEMTYEDVPAIIGQAPVTAISGSPSVENLGWVVTVNQESSEALEIVNAQTQGLAVLGVIVLGVASIASIFWARLLSAPLNRLTSVAEEVTAGNLNARANIESQDEIGALAKAFNTMTRELQSTLLGLEQRVLERTQALDTSVEIGRQLSTIMDEKELAVAVVNQVQVAFDYYHAQIYYVDELGKNLVMVGGTGAAGSVMLERNHSLPVGQGLVGRAAATNTAVFVPDVYKDTNWLPNPLLPDTRAEVAVPIAVGDRVLGVLDVQHKVVDGLDQADIALLQSLAGQVAIALQNARIFKQTQKQAEWEARINAISQQIQQADSVEDAVRTAVREVARAVGVKQASVKLTTTATGANGSGDTGKLSDRQ